jgi:5-methylcytosine-specific restriction endonuclease McrA
LPHSKFTKEEIGNMPRFCDKLRSDWWNMQDMKRIEVREKLNEEAQKRLTDRKQFYQEYLKSPEWQQKRLLVIDRQNNVCHGCMHNTIDDIHHMSYDNLGDELLFQLIGLCRDCHKKTHKIP